MHKYVRTLFLLGTISISAPVSAADEFVKPPISNQSSSFVALPRVDRLASRVATEATRKQLMDLRSIDAKAATGTVQQDYQSVVKVIDAVIAALNNRDFLTMSTYYSADPGAVFTGPILYDDTGQMVGAQNRSDYFKGLATSLAFFASVSVQRNDDEVYRIANRTAIWTATGNNLVVWKDGRTTARPWRWSIVLEKMDDGYWLVVHDHVSFGNPINAPR